MGACGQLWRAVIAAAFPAAIVAVRGQGVPDYEQPPLSYSASTPHDAFAAVQARLAAGDLRWTGDERQMLQALLATLGVPVASQTVVFSRTSFQREGIRPDHPRALYFSDSIYVGWVPGGLVEIAAVDPLLGPVFYSVDLRGPEARAPRIVRDEDCLRCHGGTFVRDIPGIFVRSVFPDRGGEPLLRFGTQVVDDGTPFAERWGGWYVTGFHGSATHRGNTWGAEKGDQLAFTPAAGRPDELSAFFDTSAYLRPTSDVAALLVLEHQLTVQNALTRAGLICRKMIAYQRGLQEAFKEPLTDEPSFDSVRSVFAGAAQDVVDRLLLRGAAELPAGIDGRADFRRAFAAAAPRSRAGHALKDLKLDGRLFEQRCSHLIYSESFRALPGPLKNRIYDRLLAVLEGRDASGRYDYLGAGERGRIREILLETHPEAAARWAGEAARTGQ